MKPLPLRVKRYVSRKLRLPVDRVRLGALNRVTPFCRNYGASRGRPIDRYYIETFLEKNREKIGGVVLEVLNNRYTLRYGGDKVTRAEVLDINEANAEATIHDDLRTLRSIDDQSFDCVVLTQTLHVIDDDAAALAQLYRILKPGGVLILTVPCISRIGKQRDDGTWNRFYTDNGISYLLHKHFPGSEIEVETYGNVVTATGFLYGLAVADLNPAHLTVNDPEYPLIVAACARKT